MPEAIPTDAPASEPPAFRPQYPGEFLIMLARDGLEALAAMARQGDVIQAQAAGSFILLSHPDDIRRVLVTEQRKFTKGWTLSRGRGLLGDGLVTSATELHRHQRRLVQPAFHRERILQYGEAMIHYTTRTLAAWEDGQRLNVHNEMMRLTLSIVGRTLFDVELEDESNRVGEALELGLRMFRFAAWPFGPLMEYAPLEWVRRFHRSREAFDALITRLIADRQRTGYHGRSDLLSVLLAAYDIDEDDIGVHDGRVRDEVVTLLIAGHETTAVALTWAFYLLSQHPEVEARMHAEVDRVLGGRAPTAADASDLGYTRMVIAETMRLYPPAWVIERRAAEDFEASGCRIPAGSNVYMSPYLVHRDPRWWEAPTRFDPDRWHPERIAERPKFSYFPFGGGARACIGEHFAWLETTLVLAMVAQQWRLRYDEPHAPLPEGLATLRPKGGLPVRLVAR